MIKIEQVRKRFGSFTAVDGVSLDIPPSGVFGLIGPNGAGKSTLFRMICQLITPDSGTITVCGHRDAMAIKACIGYLPEEHHLYESMTAEAYLRYFSDLLGLPRARPREMLQFVGLAHKAGERISRLSKGMRQKIAFARALMAEPPVLILDEPTYGLDPRTAREVRGWIRDAAATRTVVLSSHNMFESERLCDQVAILHGGRVAAFGTPRALIGRLRTAQVLDVRYRGSPEPLLAAAATLDLVAPPAREEGALRLYFAPEADAHRGIQLLLEGLRDPPDGFFIEALAPREPTLEDVFIHVTGGSAEELRDPEAPQGAP